MSKTIDLIPEGDGASPKKKTKAIKADYVRCYMSHPPLKLGNGILYGGSCSSPINDHCDVYVGLDSYMRDATVAYPWNPVPPKKSAIQIYFPITDGSPPKDKTNFVKMVDWLAEQLNAGKNVHVGCIGGHGRTGMVLAALVKTMTGEIDSITWVRDNYCKKAVESKGQVEFLHDKFGIKVVQASRSLEGGFKGICYQGTTPNFGGWEEYKSLTTGKAYIPRVDDPTLIPGTKVKRAKGPRDLAEPTDRDITATPVRTPSCIWGDLTNATGQTII